MIRFATHQKLVIGMLVVTTLGVGYALADQPNDLSDACATGAKVIHPGRHPIGPVEPQQAVDEVGVVDERARIVLGDRADVGTAQQRLFDEYAAEVKRVSGNDDGIITAAQGDIDTPTDGFADNSRLYLPPTVFNRFAVTREINDGLLAPRFAPSQRAWVLSGVRVPVDPPVDASTGRDADDR